MPVRKKRLKHPSTRLEDLPEKLAALGQMSTDELTQEYRRLCQSEPHSRHQRYLQKRIAWAMQAEVYGGLGDYERNRLEEIKAGLRLPSSDRRKRMRKADRRLPPPGSVLKRWFRGVEHEVQVLEQGYRYEGETHKSLSAVARRIAGTRWNGYLFFSLGQ